jgi:hypothetical protein
MWLSQQWIVLSKDIIRLVSVSLVLRSQAVDFRVSSDEGERSSGDE